MAYKSIPAVGLGFEVETFDPELKGKYLARYRKYEKRKNGHTIRDGWLMWPVVNGHRHHIFFADLTYNDSPAESLLATVKHRDEVLATRDPNPLPFGDSIIGSNLSGRNGISFAKERYKTGSKGQKVVHQSACWCATWNVIDPVTGKKKTVCKKMSIKKYGFLNAYKYAILFRWNWENKVRISQGKEPLKTFNIHRASWMKDEDMIGDLDTIMKKFAKNHPLSEI